MTYDQLVAFRAVVDQGGFQAAARALHLSQPAISAAIRKLEQEFSVRLFSREKYRPELTDQGRTFYEKTLVTLKQTAELEAFGHILGRGDEPEIAIAMIESVPFAVMLRMLRSFFRDYNHTRLKLFCEGVRGAEDKLRHGQAGIAISAQGPENSGSDLQRIPLGQVCLVPVCARDYPAAAFAGGQATERDMEPFVQIIIRDTAVSLEEKDFGVIGGATSSCTVNDHQTKMEIIRAGLGWGRLPHFMLADELNSGRFVSLESEQLHGVTLNLAAMRRRGPAGPVAEKLWTFIGEMAADENLIS